VSLRPNAGHGLISEVPRSHTTTHHSRQDFSGRVIRRDLYLRTHNTYIRHTYPCPPGGIRTHDHSRRAAVDLSLRPRGHWDWPKTTARSSEMSIHFDMVQHPEGFILNIYGIETAKLYVICRSFGQVFPGFLKAVQGWPKMWAPRLHLIPICGPGYRSRYGYGVYGPGLESRLGRDFPHLSRPALGPTQPPVQWVPGLSRG